MLELREHHRTRLARGETRDLMVGEIVTVYDEGRTRGLWKLGPNPMHYNIRSSGATIITLAQQLPN